VFGFISKCSFPYPISFIAFLVTSSILMFAVLVTSPDIIILFLVANVSTATLEFLSCFKYSSNIESEM